MRSRVHLISIVFLVCFFASVCVFAQSKYPERPIQIVCGSPPGAYADIAVRLLADTMTKYLGQQVLVLNKTGAGGFIAGAYVVNSKADGYTIFVGATSNANPEYQVYFKKTSYTSKDLLRVANFGGFVTLFCVNAESPWHSMKEVLEYAKNNPNKLKWGHSGVGNLYWAYGVLVTKEAGVRMQDVPFQGDAETLVALVGKHIDIGILSYGGTLDEQIKAKKLRPLFSFYNRRIEDLPDIPTAKELGFKQLLEHSILGIYAPKGTPEDIIVKLSETIRKATEDAEYRAKNEKLRMAVQYMDTKEFCECEADNVDRMRKLFKEMGYL